MNVDDFRDLLIVQSSTTGTNASNETVETWSEFCRPWGAVEPLGGGEHSLTQASQNLSEVTYLVDMRSDPDTRRIKSRMQILWDSPAGTVTLAVAAVLTPPDRERVRLLCQERGR